MTSESPSGPRSRSIGVLGATAAGLAVIAALGQAFVVLREVFVAADTGTSAPLDALLVALTAPMIFESLLSSGTQAALVPALIELNRTRGREAARTMAGVILAATVGIGIVVAALIGLFAPAAIAVTGPGLTPDLRALAQTFVPILLPLVVFSPAGTLLAATCQAQGRFRAISVSWIAGPVIALVATVGLWDALGVAALAVATTADAIATFVVLAVALGITGELPWPGRSVAADELKRFARHAIPLIAGSSVLQLNLLADRAVASLLTTGAVSALRFGERIIKAPISVLFPAWSTTVYPTIARAVLGQDEREMGRTAGDALRFVIAVFLPIAVATVALAPVIVAFAYQRGAFDARATEQTAGVVAGLAPLILLWLVLPILNGAHNARRRGGLVARSAVLSAVSNAVLDLILGSLFGVAGVALATAITSLILTVFLARRLRDLEPDFQLGPVGGVAIRALVASAVPAVPVAIFTWFVRPPLSFGGELAVLAGCTLGGAALYLALARLLDLREPWIAVAALMRSVRGRLGSVS